MTDPAAHQWLLRPYHLPLRRGVQGARGTVLALRGTAVGYARDGITGWACAPRLDAWAAWQPTIDAFARDLARCVWQADRAGLGLASWCCREFGGSPRAFVPLALTADMAALLDGSLARRAHSTGVRAVKVKVADDPPIAALATAIADLRRRRGTVSVRLDANGAFAHLGPVALGDRLAQLRDAGVDEVEDPAPWSQWPQAPPLPLALDLLDADVPTLRRLAHQGRIGLAVVKPALCGSVRAFFELAADLAAQGVPFAVSSCFDAPFGLRLLAALAAAAPGFLRPCGLATHLDLDSRLRPACLAIRNGRWTQAVADDVRPADRVAPPWDDLLAQAAARAPEQRALTWFTSGRMHGWSWRQLDRCADRVARGVRRAGLEPGAAVALWCDNGPDLVAVLWGIWRAGLAAAPGHPRWTVDEFARWHAQVRPVGCIVDAHHPWPQATLVDQALHGRLQPYDVAQVVLRRTGGGALVATSGTTGMPKVVELGPQHLAAASFAFWQRHAPQPGDRWLLPLPLCHVAGLVALWRCAAACVEAVLSPAPDAEAICRASARRPSTLISLVPTLLHRLLAVGARPGRARVVLVGGASAPPELLARARAAGWPVAPSYGMTETAAAVAVGDLQDASAQQGPYRLVGRPLPGVELRIGPRDEIQVRGASVTGPTGTWLDTGDTGRLDDLGRLWVASRRADRIVRGGENVDPLEVEAAVRKVAGVDDVAVVGLADAELGECVAAWVAVAPAAADLTASLAAAVAGLAPFKRPVRWLVTPNPLPRNAMGKVDLAAVRHAVADAQRLGLTADLGIAGVCAPPQGEDPGPAASGCL
ncbi:MAG: AMP-binding protein [Deltaproteobacteria bacterium]|nr:AMP-binding protein [Deltaproteobacteria bacterium]